MLAAGLLCLMLLPFYPLALLFWKLDDLRGLKSSLSGSQGSSASATIHLALDLMASPRPNLAVLLGGLAAYTASAAGFFAAAAFTGSNGS